MDFFPLTCYISPCKLSPGLKRQGSEWKRDQSFLYSAAECPIYLFFLNIINGFKGIKCLPFKGIPSGFQKHSSVCVPNDMTQILLELRLQHCTVIVMGFSTYGSAMQKNQKVLLKFPQFKTLQSCSSKQECCSNVKHITAVYSMIIFRSRCTRLHTLPLLHQQLCLAALCNCLQLDKFLCIFFLLVTNLFWQ